MGSILLIRLLVAWVLALASMAIAMPTSPPKATTIRTTICPDDSLVEPPPRTRTLIEQMNIQASDDGILPECYKKCMKSEDGKANITISNLTIEGWCYNSVDFVNSQIWLNNYVLPCVKYECADNMSGKARRARAWWRDTCRYWDKKSTPKTDAGCEKGEGEELTEEENKEDKGEKKEKKVEEEKGEEEEEEKEKEGKKEKEEESDYGVKYGYGYVI
ncbi:hypothetical protein PspLS_02427 [Pyricularia sp. CBS 133598]|nr:hypothetical protein PspLS_02427 [Pyricularia sp. CBS 133598]